MIGWLSGIPRELDPIGIILLDVQGVGYEVSVSLQTLCSVKLGEKTNLNIHTYVREDQITLFGFTTPAERSMFRQLNKVSGIGARMALNLMSGMSASDLATAIEQADDVTIARTPGIGKKTAQRLILELQGKLNTEHTSDATASGNHELHDVRSALLNLGYKLPQIDAALKSVDTSLGFEAIFKATLKTLT